MTPSQQSKAHSGLMLSVVSRRSGYPVSTLRDMHKHHPRRFECVCLGAIQMRPTTQRNDRMKIDEVVEVGDPWNSREIEKELSQIDDRLDRIEQKLDRLLNTPSIHGQYRRGPVKQASGG